MSTSHPDDPNRPAAVSCQEAVELLPWLVNGSLADDERRGLVEHLSSCASCRRELEQTAEAWRLMTHHVPSLALAEYSQGLSPSGVDRERIERHLALCPSCRQELAGALPAEIVDFASARAERALRRRPPGRAIPTTWRALAAAASIVLALISGALLQKLAYRDGTGETTTTITAETPPEEDGGHGRAFDDGRPGTDCPPDATAIFVSGFESGDLSCWNQAAPDRLPTNPISNI